MDYILDTFPIVRRKDEAEHGEYRMKRVILEIYDAMQQTAATGAPYQTRLDCRLSMRKGEAFCLLGVPTR